MGLTRADLIGDMTDEERASRQFWIDRTAANDSWAKKTLQPLAILLTSHQANRPYLKASVESHSKLGYWLTLAYDSYVDPTWEALDHNQFMPAKDTLDRVDLFLMGHYQTWGGPLYPYYWLVKWGASILRDFEMVYCANGDFVVEKPEGFPALLELMGDADIMTSGPDRDEPPAANTAGFIVRTDALKKIVQHFQEHLVPWENYEKHTQRIGNMEGRLGWAIKDLGLKQKRVAPPKEDMFRHPGTGTWYDLIGFRHIHAELNHAYRNKGIPPPMKYLDERFAAPHDFSFIKKYEETGDPKVLEEWWAKD